MQIKYLFILSFMAIVCANPLFAAIYYVDAVDGNDLYSGTSEALAWQSLDRVSDTTFSAGDQILLNAGDAWSGEMDLNGNGMAGNPIIVDMYGSGAKPFIDGAGFESAVRLQNVSYWQVNNLEITNNGGATQSGASDYRVGVLVKSGSSGIRRHIWLRNLTIHDIFPETGPYGHGIHIAAIGSSTRDTYFDDVLVEDCHISVTGRYGIWCQHKGSVQSNPGYKYNTNIVFRDNIFLNNGGSGVETGWCDGVLLEHNIVDHSGASVDPRQWARGSGYWPWKSKNVLVQHNEFRHARGEADSCGAHIDFGCENVTMQYNLSIDNEGGFVEILGDCLNSTYRYNVSINDGARVKGVGGATQDGHLIWVSSYNGSGNPTVGSINSSIYNNTMYVRPGITNFIKIMNKATDTLIANNIFYMDGSATYTDAGTNTAFENNLWHGNLPAGVPFGPNSIFIDPLLTNPGGENAIDYLIASNSAAIDQGILIPDNGGRDYFGNAAGAGLLPDIGAHEHPDANSNTGVYSGETLLFNPIGDTYSKQNDATANFGNSPVMQVRSNSTKGKNSYLKFDVSGVTGAVQSALLKMRIGVNPIDDLTVHTVDDTTWDEMTVTWNNAPPVGAGIDSVYDLLPETWYQWDITSAITGDGLYSFALTSQVDLAYREIFTKDSSYAPLLIIVHIAGNSPDISGNGDINYSDFATISAYFMDGCSPPGWCDGADLNVNGSVDPNDVRILAQSWLGLP